MATLRCSVLPPFPLVAQGATFLHVWETIRGWVSPLCVERFSWVPFSPEVVPEPIVAQGDVYALTLRVVESWSSLALRSPEAVLLFSPRVVEAFQFLVWPHAGVIRGSRVAEIEALLQDISVPSPIVPVVPVSVLHQAPPPLMAAPILQAQSIGMFGTHADIVLLQQQHQ